MKKVAILGAGISGLSLAYFLERERPDLEVTIYEKSRRVGGWIRSHWMDGQLFERGPRSVRTAGYGAETLELVRALDLESEMVLPSKDAKRRFLWTDGKLQALPSGPQGLLFNPLLRGMRRSILRERKVPTGVEEDETIHAFFSRRFGELLADRLVDPVVAGIFAGDPRKLSLRSCFPRLYEAEQTRGSVLRGMKGGKRHPFPMFSFREGMETLPRRLAERIRSPMQFGAEVKSLEEIDADHIYSTLPAHALTHLLPELKAIPFQTVVTVGLLYPGQVLDRPGFGYLIPSMEQQEILGCVFDSCVFHEQNRGDVTRLTVMIGGARKRNDEFVALARENLERHLGLRAEPAVASVARASRAIPQYPVGHHRLVGTLQIPDRLTLLGTSFYGVSVNDCVHTARLLAEAQV